MKFFFGILQDFWLKNLEDLFYYELPYFYRTMYICSNSKHVVHGHFKIIQNYVNNKIKN